MVKLFKLGWFEQNTNGQQTFLFTKSHPLQTNNFENVVKKQFVPHTVITSKQRILINNY